MNSQSDNYNSSKGAAEFEIVQTTSSIKINNVTNGIYDTLNVTVGLSVVNQTVVSFVISNGTHNFTVILGENGNVDLIKNEGEFSNVNVTSILTSHAGFENNYAISISGLESGIYNMTVYNAESNNYIKSSDNRLVNVSKATSRVDITTVDGVYNTTGVIVNFTIINQTDLSKVYFVVVNSEGNKFNVSLTDIINGNVNDTLNLFPSELTTTK